MTQQALPDAATSAALPGPHPVAALHTRPRNRRAMIIAAATDLFGANGYEYVGMSEIADAVGVGPSALYRHFPSKEQLLESILRLGVAELETTIARVELARGSAGLMELAEYVVANRGMVALLARETSHLPEDPRVGLDAWVRQLIAMMAGHIASARPGVSPQRADLLALAALSAMQGPAFTHTDLSAADHALAMAELAAHLIAAPAGIAEYSGEKLPERARTLTAHSRREALLAQAVSLFAQRTYASVSIEDIASAQNIAGPSVYNHFRSKAEILEVALSRGSAYLSVELADALATSDGPAEALCRVLSSYVRFAFTNPAIIDLLISEVGSLAEPARQAKLSAQRDYIAELAHLLTQVDPGLPRARARIRVQAALMITNDTARNVDLRDRAGLPAAVLELCQHLLGLPPHRSAEPVTGTTPIAGPATGLEHDREA